MLDPRLPGPESPLLDSGGYARTEWYDFFRLLADRGVITQEQFDALVARVDALENGGDWLPNTTTATGILSVQSIGSLANGSVSFQLVGDQQSPGPDHYYGTDANSAKGFHALPSGIPPYFIPAGETYTVPLYKQALFTMPIDAEGLMVVDGYLVEVT